MTYLTIVIKLMQFDICFYKIVDFNAISHNIFDYYTAKLQQIPSPKHRPFYVHRQKITKLPSILSVFIQQIAIYLWESWNPWYNCWSQACHVKSRKP